MSADTLTADGAAVTISPPGADSGGHAYSFWGYTALPGSDEIIALVASGSPSGGSASEITAAGYSLSGALLFQTTLADANGVPTGLVAPSLALLASGNVVFAFNSVDYTSQIGHSNNHYALVSPSGSILVQGITASDHGTDQYGDYSVPIQGAPTLYATDLGFTMEWNQESSGAYPPIRYGYAVQTFNMSGNGSTRTVTLESGWDQITPTVHGFAADGAIRVQLTDNQLQFYEGSVLHGQSVLPGEPAHAITDEAAAVLSSTTAAVAWVDSGTDYVSIYNTQSNNFGSTIGLDWGGASDLHLVALPDGGFAVSWMNGGAYKGELFDSAGNGGGVISLAGDVAGIDGHGDLYTVGQDSSGNEVIQTYAINSAGSSGGGAGGSTTGQTYTSDNNGDHWVGTSSDDTFHLGRGGDVVTGNGGNDTYSFAEIPWAGGHITDFNPGDVLDLTGLMSTTADTGSNGFADGYLKLGSDSNGNAQVWARYATSGANSNWWLVETLDGVASPSLTTTGDEVTIGAPGSAQTIYTADANYTVPWGMTGTVVLTGSQQNVDASHVQDVTIVSNDTGNTFVAGGSNFNTYDLGRGGDSVLRADGGGLTFVYDQTPWAAGHIDIIWGGIGAKIDVSGMLAHDGYTGSDPFADGYLKVTADSSGNAVIWSDVNQPGNDGWWQVTTLKGLSPELLTYSNGVFTTTDMVTTDAPNFTIPMGGSVVQLTGSGQVVHGGQATSNVIMDGDAYYNTMIADNNPTSFNMGTGGGLVTGSPYHDSLGFTQLPTAPTEFTNFQPGTDQVWLGNLLQTYEEPGAYPDGAGMVNIVDDGHGNAQIWFESDPSHSSGWIQLATLDHIAPSQVSDHGMYIS